MSSLPSDSEASEQQGLECLRPHKGKEQAGTAVNETPAARLHVTFNDGKLTVDPHEATLGEVLGAIRSIAGFKLDIPNQGMDKLVFDQIGPLPVREALVQLLYGSGFNYIIQTAQDNPQDVTQVFLSSRMHSTTEAAAPNPTQPAEEVGEQQVLSSGVAEPSPQEQPVSQPAVAQQAPPANPANVPGVPTGFNLQQAAATANKSPAEILDELQKRQLEILDAQAPPQ